MGFTVSESSTVDSSEEESSSSVSESSAVDSSSEEDSSTISESSDPGSSFELKKKQTDSVEQAKPRI